MFFLGFVFSGIIISGMFIFVGMYNFSLIVIDVSLGLGGLYFKLVNLSIMV